MKEGKWKRVTELEKYAEYMVMNEKISVKKKRSLSWFN